MRLVLKTLFTLVAVLFLNAGLLKAQELIAVNHAAGGSDFYTRLDSAIVHASNGDYVYIPGTSMMSIGTLTIDKSVNLVGAGINPDSCLATGTTILTGNIIFVAGADNGSMQGIMLTGYLAFGSSLSNQHLSGFYVSRCNLATVYLSYNGADTTTSSFLFRENIIRGHVYGGHSNAIFKNNIFEGQLNYFDGATFANNDFLWGSQSTLNNNVRNSTFSNNIFRNSCFAHYGYYTIYCTDNNYYNNLYNGPMLFFNDYYSCIANNNGIGFITGNLENVSNSQIYTDQAGGTYDIHHNYHLTPDSPGKNAGTDGTDVGIYGGSEPFKDGSLPVNPHIRYKSVAGSTNPNGTLNIHFKVETQER